MSKKWLFDFEVIREVVEKEETTSKNDKGEEVTVKKDVVSKKPVTFRMQKPNRKMYENGELFYAVKLSEGIKAGLLTKPLLAKRYKDDGGPLSDDEKSHYAELFYEMAKKQDDLEKLKLNLENKDKETRERAAGELMADILQLREELQEYELAQSSLFDQTAENRAKNQTIMWWVLNLAYEKTGETRHAPVFGEGSYEEKLDKYDELEESDDPFWTEVVKKFAYFVTFWYLNGISNQKEFEEVEKLYAAEAAGGFFEEEAEEEVAEEEVAEEEVAEAKKPKKKPAKKKAAKKKPEKKEAKAEEAPKEEAVTEEAVEEESVEKKEIVAKQNEETPEVS